MYIYIHIHMCIYSTVITYKERERKHKRVREGNKTTFILTHSLGIFSKARTGTPHAQTISQNSLQAPVFPWLYGRYTFMTQTSGGAPSQVVESTAVLLERSVSWFSNRNKFHAISRAHDVMASLQTF